MLFVASIGAVIVPGAVAPAPAHAQTYYGAIAISGDGSWGRALNYPSAGAANRAAWNECPRTDCKVVATFANGCGAVIKHTDYWGFGSEGGSKFQGGIGRTQRAAIADAQRRARGGSFVVGGCTIRG
ncbi:DUF4189 domain-containing protein [Gordonia sp. ABSL1-1]|uniref:DUF4189 domain-containing protein n=1 Tax=Gordonia sp. ABSL1-1 TaxID=3053923 RepID=UPI0025731A5A|nr:DUF4189 domain-containing protein [Gordonia sp. ABSL1-1]MDL9937523.1 DUF4189 domain-containing protein [Gordonia sp. ABSL1-1]